MKKQKNKAKSKNGCLIAVIVVLALILVAMITVTVFVEKMLGKITREDELLETLSQEEIDSILSATELEDLEYTGEVMDPADVTLPQEPVKAVETSDNIINILLVGQDTYSNNNRSRSDSMILCTINKKDKTLTMTSFMRDLYVAIPGYQDQRLNVPYVLGGFNKLYETLEHNFGVVVDHGIAVNFSSFPKVIDAVGGVDIELTKAEARHLNGQKDSWNFSSGVNHLSGSQALAYSRIRKIDSDFNRTNRQRKVITALLEKVKTLPLKDMYTLVETLIPMVVTDMSNAEIIDTAMDLAPLLLDLEIITQRIPVDGEYKSTMIRGMAVLVADTEANRQFLEDTIGDIEETE